MDYKNDSSKVALYELNIKKYPKKSPFHPDKSYPEYPFKKTSVNKNFVYEAFRNLLVLMNLDVENFNSTDWNPLGKIIKPGDTVTIKPNLVIDNLNKQNFITTHPSLIRAVTDYVLIALKGKGRLIIGDAPLQKCDFKKLVNYIGLIDILEFYSDNGVNAQLIDFRKEYLITNQIKSLKTKKNVRIINLKGDPNGYTEIDLGNQSFHHLINSNEMFRKYKVTNYDPKIMNKAHSRFYHKYIISNSILKADVIINLPKIKSHRKAGITGGLKNIVGINGNKDWLPHHTIGSLQENGDEYPNKDIMKTLYTKINIYNDLLLINNPIIHNLLFYPIFLIKTILLKILKFNANNGILEGSWYGNDTIWRTIGDLNQILFYADKEGKLRKETQRKCILFYDGIIIGEGEGPMDTEPNHAGILLGGYDPLMIDLAVSELLDLDYKKIPQLFKIINSNKNISKNQPEELKIISNMDYWNNKKIGQLNKTLKFKPTENWINHIEKK
ncbi:MAG: DUF362 domain-containing protein [Candidatus Lokiarchaeota archaeon]|nr:DUF362 domain-containing protein [Candidatus Lokiarchaeota archaeon]MBD3200000.1 DUF362 domain-containing protein [Candidatus Lokiarchaeota archaeon]